MSDDDTPPQGPPPAYPPPPGYGYPPPGGGYPPPGYAYPSYAAPRHPRATTAMVLGIISVAGAFICYLPVLMAPFAWFMGAKAVREIDASGGTQGGRSEASAGRILGIIGTVLLAIGLALLVLFIVLLATVHGFWDDFTSGWESDY